ncbi:reprolysin-like metallopeptidase [uncultured Aquimarina sp.]|uniref:reprolysin-like metallopeptidase n=1 Tax=uncultured Aquimarina sp. TaxID=575652 RepID=UPI002611A5EF|nr:zinc-dependent metalloprotease family protein [uncultured Aquimarina sp.]
MSKITLPTFIRIFFFLALSTQLNAQDIWWEKSAKSDSEIKVTSENQYSAFDINSNTVDNVLDQIYSNVFYNEGDLVMSFPNDKEGYTNYTISETEVMHPKLAVKYPQIRTFVGFSIENPKEVIRFSYCPVVGLNGSIISPGKNTLIIKPINKTSHILYNAKAEISDSLFDCQTEELSKAIGVQTFGNEKNANDGNLRRYRLALSVSGDYSQFFLDGTEIDDIERRIKVMTAMVSSINRVNGIFERDFGVTMQIIPENDSLIFLDPSSDPYTTGGNLNGQLQSSIDTDPSIGSAAYDVGHLFHFENAVYGNAGCIACVCTDGSKGSAFTTHRDPSSDNFNLIVAHEFGHQFGGYHVQSSSNCRSGVNSEVEPGSGSSIMGYAGICSPDVQNTPDDYFNFVDIRDVAIWTIDNSNCAEIIPTGNTAPVVDAGNDYTIPGSTPFVLEGSATDIDGEESLSYCWEQNNPEDPFSSSFPQATWVNGPLFRSKLPSGSAKRYLPQLTDVLNGNLTPTWEVLPSVSRTMRFELTVRDNIPQGGQTNTDGILVTVDGNSGPFMVTSQNTAEVWNVGEEVTVNWDVANTNLTPVNAGNVDILLSVDGGYTYPYTIQDDIVNDGSETFSLPNVDGTTTARIMVKASDNIFFAVNSIDFTIQTSEFIIAPTTTTVAVCQSDDAIYNIEYRTFLDFNEEVTFSAENLPFGTQVNFTPSSISGSHVNGTSIEARITGTENLAVGFYELSIKGNSNFGIEKEATVNLEIFSNTIVPSTLISPTNNEIGFGIDSLFEWSNDVNSDTYEIQIATDSNFLDIIESAIVTESNYTAELLGYDSSYFWRVRSNNPCGISEFSINNSFTTQCSSPENFRSIANGPSYVELDWTDVNSTEWEIEYGFSGFELGNGNVITVTSVPYQIPGLDSSTDYDFYLRSTCLVGGISTSLGPVSVATTQDFCAGDHFYDSGGVDGNYTNNENITTVISPSNSADRVRVVFDAFSLESGFDSLRVYDGPNDSYPALHQGGGFTGASIASAFVSSDISGSLTFVFTSDGSVTYSGWDARVICEPKPNCDVPYDFVVNTVNSDSVTLSWSTDNQSSSWDLEYGLQGFEEGTGTVVVSNSQVNYSIDQLDPITTYDVYIRGNCAIGGVSDKVGPITFQTLCDITQAPFSESFDAFSTPQCWLESGIGAWNYSLSASYDASQAGDRNVQGNTNYAWIDGSAPNGENQISILTTPLIDISALTIPSVQFSVFSKNTIDNTYNSLQVDFYDGINWNTILELQENTGGWRDIAINIENYIISGPIQVRFTVTENSTGNSEYNDVLIDEIKIDEMPSCQNPYQLEVLEVKGRSAVLSWIASDMELSWELQYGLQGFTPATAINEVVTVNPYEITGLEPTTTYELYLRAICDSATGDNSDFIGPIIFTTDCDPYTAPFIENYASFGRPICWQEQGDVNWNYGLYFDSNIQAQIPDRTTGAETNYTWKYNNFNNIQDPEYLISPFIDVSALNIPSIQFSLYSNSISNENYNTLTVEFFDGLNWNTLLTFEEPTLGWKDYYYDISSYTITDDIKIRFGILENINSSEYNYILIDDVKVDELPSCFNPNSLLVTSVTTDSATVSWLVGNSETSWQIQYGEEGFGLGSGTIIDTIDNPETITNLSSNTKYDVYLRSNCEVNGFSDWIGPVSLKTQADFCSGDRFYDSGGVNGDYSNNENETTVVSPQNSQDRIRVVFDSFLLEGCCDSLSVYDGPDTSSPFLGSFTGSNSPGEIVSNHESGSLTFVFRSDGSVTYSGWDARVICEPKPNCDAPVNVFVSNILSNEADLSWTASGLDSNWEIEYGAIGFNQGSGTTVTASSSPYTLIELSSDTSYDVYIKTICDAGGYSDVRGPFNFRTQVSCPVPTGFVINGVTSNSADLGWNANGGNELFWELEYGISGFVQGSGDSLRSNTNTIELENLESTATYDVYIKANCGNNDTSTWTGPYNFRTSCSTISDNPNEYIQNGSFECGDLGSWRSIGPGNTSGCRMNFTVLDNSSNVCVIVPEVNPSEGQFAAYTSFDGNAGDTYILEQTVSLPSNLSTSLSAVISFDFRAEYDVTYGTATAERTLNVDLYDSSNNFIRSIEEQSFGINPQIGSIDLSFSQDILNEILSYSGQEIILRFSAYIPDSSTGPAKAMIDNVSLIIENTLSTEEEEIVSNEVLLFPNPNKGSFVLNYKGQNNLEKLLIYDITGKIVYEETLSGFNEQKQISLNNAQAGIYLARIISDKGVVTKRIIIE